MTFQNCLNVGNWHLFSDTLKFSETFFEWYIWLNYYQDDNNLRVFWGKFNYANDCSLVVFIWHLYLIQCQEHWESRAFLTPAELWDSILSFMLGRRRTLHRLWVLISKKKCKYSREVGWKETWKINSSVGTLEGTHPDNNSIIIHGYATQNINL